MNPFSAPLPLFLLQIGAAVRHLQFYHASWRIFSLSVAVVKKARCSLCSEMEDSLEDRICAIEKALGIDECADVGAP